MARSGADVALMWSVLTATPVPEPRLAGTTVGLLTRPPSVGGSASPAENRAAETYVERLEELGARVVETEIPEPPADTWPLFFHEASESHPEPFPAPAAQYGDNPRGQLDHAHA